MAQYSDHVIGLRKQYWLLSIPVQRWVREMPEPTPSTPQDIIG
jgi:hypothetical protein